MAVSALPRSSKIQFPRFKTPSPVKSPVSLSCASLLCLPVLRWRPNANEREQRLHFTSSYQASRDCRAVRAALQAARTFCQDVQAGGLGGCCSLAELAADPKRKIGTRCVGIGCRHLRPTRTIASSRGRGAQADGQRRSIAIGNAVGSGQSNLCRMSSPFGRYVADLCQFYC